MSWWPFGNSSGAVDPMQSQAGNQTSGSGLSAAAGQSIGIGSLTTPPNHNAINGTIHWNGSVSGPSGTVYTTSTAYNTIHIVLSPEEKKELDLLVADFEIDKKQLKLKEFKKLSPEIRQYVINAQTWQHTLHIINSTEPEKSERLKELESKPTHPYTLSGQNIGLTMGGYYTIPVSLPDGLTLEDISQAHVEQTLEDEMLDGEAK